MAEDPGPQQEGAAGGCPGRLTLQERLEFAYHVHHYMTQQAQFADLKASGVLVAAGALLAYVVTALFITLSEGSTPNAVGIFVAAIIGIVSLGGGTVACLACVWPRVWRTDDTAGPASLFDFGQCNCDQYARRLAEVGREEALTELLDGVGRHARVASYKYGLMRLAIVLTMVGGLAGIALLYFVSPQRHLSGGGGRSGERGGPAAGSLRRREHAHQAGLSARREVERCSAWGFSCWLPFVRPRCW